MDGQKLIKWVRLFFVLFNLSVVTDMVSVYLRIFAPHTPLFRLFQPVGPNNVLLPDGPITLLVLAIVTFLWISKYVYRRIANRILTHS
ncbi:MAG: hypothetical protein M0Z55_03665 [Peptococcaceae bacterium]|nr:hypothetical protein [Peptococcaceae bacterium]